MTMGAVLAVALKAWSVAVGASLTPVTVMVPRAKSEVAP